VTDPTLPALAPERKRSRLLEDVGFAAAIAVGIFAAGREAIAPSAGGFPWALAIVMAVLAAPKTLGRATSGRLWEALASRFGLGGKS
jgi:hypothetical protein